MAIRVLIAEDEAPLRDALAALIDGEPEFEVVGAAGGAEEAEAKAAASLPDVALVDVRMPGGGPQAVHAIRERSPHTRVLGLSAYEDRATVFEMLRCGAIGYLVKGVGGEEIVQAIQRAVRNQASISADVITGVIDELVADMDERRAAEEVLRRSEQRFATLLESAPDAVAIIDERGRIVLINEQTERLFGYARDELIGREVEILLPERFRGRHDGHRAGYFADPRTRPMGIDLELAGRRRDGTEFPVDISLSAIETDDGRLATAFIRDITERSNRQEIERDHAARRELLSHLVAASEEERRRIAGDIHDDSIQAITAAGIRLDILRRSIDDPGQLELLGELERTIQLSISRLRHLLFELRPPALDNEGLSAALAMYLDEIEDENEISWRLDDRLTTQPPAETRVILYRIAQEALTNARKQAQPSTVTVHLGEVARGYLVKVIDDGVGFSPDGAGPAPGHLGLAAMRERANLAGGSLRLESAPGEGTTVEVWIPA